MAERPPPGRRAARGALAPAVAVAALLLLAPAGHRLWQAHRQAELGERLLRGGDGAAVVAGAAVLRGRLAGHPEALPPEATRCVNCHTTGAGAGPAGTAAFGPSLDPVTLARPASRRGGPPSRYDAASLCRLLREGIDPAWVMVDAAMPRYEVSDAQCRALWVRLDRATLS